MFTSFPEPSYRNLVLSNFRITFLRMIYVQQQILKLVISERDNTKMNYFAFSAAELCLQNPYSNTPYSFINRLSQSPNVKYKTVSPVSTDTHGVQLLGKKNIYNNDFIFINWKISNYSTSLQQYHIIFDNVSYLQVSKIKSLPDFSFQNSVLILVHMIFTITYLINIKN